MKRYYAILALLVIFLAAFPEGAFARGRSSSGGRVSVRGYTRKDGTYVRPHTRSYPGSGGGSYQPGISDSGVSAPDVNDDVQNQSTPGARLNARTSSRTAVRTSGKTTARSSLQTEIQQPDLTSLVGEQSRQKERTRLGDEGLQSEQLDGAKEAGNKANILKENLERELEEKNLQEQKDAAEQKAEKMAASKLSLAHQLIKGQKFPGARRFLQDIIREYPKTNAAAEAKTLLEGIKEF